MPKASASASGRASRAIAPVERPRAEWDVWEGTDPRVRRDAAGALATRRQRNGDVKGKPLSYEIRKRVVGLLDEGAHTDAHIAAQLSIHPRTVASIRRAVQEQAIPIVTVGNQTRTTGVPVPARAGGFRWCKLTSEQKALCARIAIENPMLTIAQIRAELNRQCGTSVSESTVYRTMRNSNIQYMRAKMKDPRAEGSRAHREELDAFMKEQQKGASGALAVEDLFFMDETTIYLNEAPTYAWGTRKNEPSLVKAKGKTMTIAIYAGIGLTSHAARVADGRALCDVAPTAPRSNAFRIADDGCWRRAEPPPRFCLVWWMRPPERDSDALLRFLDVDDVGDPSYVLPYEAEEGAQLELVPAWKALGGPLLVRRPSRIDVDPRGLVVRFGAATDGDATVDDDDELLVAVVEAPTGARVHDLGRGSAIRWTDELAQLSRGATLRVLDDDGVPHHFVNRAADVEVAPKLEWLLGLEPTALDEQALARYLWFLGVETRPVDDAGELVRVAATGEQLAPTLERMRELFAKTQRLLRYARDGDGGGGYPTDVPRNFGTLRSFRGGTLKSTRGDRGLFLRYLRHVDAIFKAHFSPPGGATRFRFAWDSAPQHGKVDVTQRKKSFVHEWVEQKFGVQALFLPVRKPDYNPVEFLFSFVKGAVRRRMTSVSGEVTPLQMMAMLDAVFGEVTIDMLKGWLRYGCYLVPGEAPTAACARQPALLRPDVTAAVIDAWQARHGDLAAHGADVQRLRSTERDERRAARRFMCLFRTLAAVEAWQPPDDVAAYGPSPAFAAMKRCVDEGRPYTAQLVRAFPLFDKHAPLEPTDEIRVVDPANGGAELGRFRNRLERFADLSRSLLHCDDEESVGCALELLRARAGEASPSRAACARVLERLRQEFAGARGLLARLLSARDVVFAHAFAAIAAQQTAAARATTDEELLDALLDLQRDEGIGNDSLVGDVRERLRDTPYGVSLDRAVAGSVAPRRDALVVALAAYLHERRRADAAQREIVRLVHDAVADDSVATDVASWDALATRLRWHEARWKRRCATAAAARAGASCGRDGDEGALGEAADLDADAQAPLLDIDALRRERAQRRGEKRTDGRRWPGYGDDGEGYEVVKTGVYDEAPVVARVHVGRAADGAASLRVTLESGVTHEFPVDEASGKLLGAAPADAREAFRVIFGDDSEEATENVRKRELAWQRHRLARARPADNAPPARATEVLATIGPHRVTRGTAEVDAATLTRADSPDVVLLIVSGGRLYPNLPASYAETRERMRTVETVRLYLATGADYGAEDAKFAPLQFARGRTRSETLRVAELSRAPWSLRPHPLRFLFAQNFYKFPPPRGAPASLLKQYGANVRDDVPTPEHVARLSDQVSLSVATVTSDGRQLLVGVYANGAVHALVSTKELVRLQDEWRPWVSTADGFKREPPHADPVRALSVAREAFDGLYGDIVRQYAAAEHAP